MLGAAKDDKVLRVFLKSHSIHSYSSISSPLYSSPKNSHGKSFNDHTIRRISHSMQENKKPLLQRAFKVTSMQTPLEEELYNVKVEPKVSQGRLDELGVSRWSVWMTGSANCLGTGRWISWFT
ncbi:unnamed protein product [Brassica oleracea var. botrytis]